MLTELFQELSPELLQSISGGATIVDLPISSLPPDVTQTLTSGQPTTNLAALYSAFNSIRTIPT